MANTSRPIGATPVGPVHSLQPYVAAAACYPGDFVKMDNTGRVLPASAGDALLGVAVGYASAAGDTIMISDAPEQRYRLESSSTEVDAQTDIGNSADIVATSPNTTYKISRHKLDSSTLATSTAQLTLLGVENAANDSIGTSCKCIVRINEHQITGVNAFAGI